MNGNFDEQGEQGLRHALWSVRRFLPELVLIGGWVPYIYRRYGGFSEWGSGLSGTTELDLLVAPKDHADDGGTLADALRLAGFGPRAEGAVWESPDPAARIEFMTIHRGTAANLGRVVPLHHAGVGAIALRDLTLLGEFTTTVQLPVALVEGALQSVDLRVPTLGAYALNKGLTFPYRPAEPGEGASPRSGKDVLTCAILWRQVMKSWIRSAETSRRFEAEVTRRMSSGHARTYTSCCMASCAATLPGLRRSSGKGRARTKRKQNPTLRDT
jgi:hypothetical protein